MLSWELLVPPVLAGSQVTSQSVIWSCFQSQRIPTLWIKTLTFDVSSSELLLLCCQRHWALPKALQVTRYSAYFASPGNPWNPNVSETAESKGRERNSINNNKWGSFQSRETRGKGMSTTCHVMYYGNIICHNTTSNSSIFWLSI